MNSNGKISGWAIPIRTLAEFQAIYANNDLLVSELLSTSANNGLFYPDHTYVVFEHPEVRLGCWGRYNGGTQISQGLGNLDQMIAAATPSGHADIIYGITGVCHQTANRILKGAGSAETVHKATGYGITSLLYGTYGRGALLDKKLIEALRSVQLDNLEQPYYSHAIDKAYIHYADLVAANKITLDKAVHEISKIELNTYIDYKFTTSIHQELVENLVVSKNDLNYNLTYNLNNLTSNAMVNDFLGVCSEILSEKQFEKIFDIAPSVQVFFPEMKENELVS